MSLKIKHPGFFVVLAFSLLLFSCDNPEGNKAGLSNDKKNIFGSSWLQRYEVTDSKSVVQFILSCQKPGGGFGPINLEYEDLAWTYPAVHALNILGEEIPNADSCFINGGKSWIEKAPWKNGPWYWSLQQKANLYKIMHKTGALEKDLVPEIKLKLQFEPRTDYTEFRKYSEGIFFDMASLWNITEAVQILSGSIENPEYIKEYVLKRRAPEGGFDDMLGKRESPEDNKSHLIIAHDAIMILNALNLSVPEPDRLINWILSCQTPEGGFQWHPEHPSTSNRADIWYTWAAIRALDVFGRKPRDTQGCIKWINSLQNRDGGFGDRPGWYSRLYSTYYAVHALDMLTGDIKNAISEKRLHKKSIPKIPENIYSIFQAHHKSPSGGEEMVDMIASMGLNFIAVKTTEKELYESDGVSEVVKKAREYSEKKNYDLEIVDSPENYKHRLTWFSGMEGNHVSNFMIPPRLIINGWESILSAYGSGLLGYDWEIFKKIVIRPVLQHKTLFYPELDYTMQNAYMVYDEGLDGETGYNGVPAAHFGNYDWVRHFPYKERWIGQLPMIADGDAHAEIIKWKHNLDSYRNIFIAKSYKFEDYVDASLNGRSVCVIRMPESGEIRYYGSPEAINYLKKHFSEWKWWNE